MGSPKAMLIRCAGNPKQRGREVNSRPRHRADPASSKAVGTRRIGPGASMLYCLDGFRTHTPGLSGRGGELFCPPAQGGRVSEARGMTAALECIKWKERAAAVAARRQRFPYAWGFNVGLKGPIAYHGKSGRHGHCTLSPSDSEEAGGAWTIDVLVCAIGATPLIPYRCRRFQRAAGQVMTVIHSRNNGWVSQLK